MGRTIPSFRLASVIEEQEWKDTFVKYLDKTDKRIFRDMFSVSILYNSACSYSTKHVRLYPILYSIIFHQYKILKKKLENMAYIDKENNIDNKDDANNEDNIQITNTTIFPYDDIVTKEIESWKGYAQCLRKKDRKLFYQMLSGCYNYSKAIHFKGKEQSTNSILMSILLENYKRMKKITD